MKAKSPFAAAMDKLMQENHEACMRFVNCMIYSEGPGDVGPTPTTKRKLVEVTENGKKFMRMV